MGSSTSHRRFLIACVAILAIAVAIGGCFGSPSGAVVKGHVTEIDFSNEDALRFEAGLFSSGPGVSGAQVILQAGSETHTKTTDSFGRFTFANVSPGTYRITVSKSGFASSTAYDVRVASYRTNEIELRMVKPPTSSITETNPPDVYLSCPSRVDGTGYITASATDASGIAGILLFIDNSYVELFGTEGTYQWNTFSGPSVADNGEHTITAMAIDNCGNIGYKSIVVTVDNVGLPINPPEPPMNVKAGTLTVHYSVFDLINELEKEYRVSTSSSLANEILGLAKSVQEAGSQIRPLAMPAGSEAVTASIVAWDWKNSDRSIKGFKIYRDGVFIGESPAQPSGTRAVLIQPRPPDTREVGYYIDGSSKLTPDVPVSYRVSAYNGWGEGDKSSSATTTPLNALSKVAVVKPLTPAIVPDPDNEPWFEWETVPSARLYLIKVMSADSMVMWQGYAYENECSVYYGRPDRTIRESQPLTTGQYYFYILAINSRQNPPITFDSADWSHIDRSISASGLARFNWTQD